jgi:hypothetical protein
MTIAILSAVLQLRKKIARRTRLCLPVFISHQISPLVVFHHHRAPSNAPTCRKRSSKHRRHPHERSHTCFDALFPTSPSHRRTLASHQEGRVCRAISLHARCNAHMGLGQTPSTLVDPKLRAGRPLKRRSAYLVVCDTVYHVSGLFAASS